MLHLVRLYMSKLPKIKEWKMVFDWYLQFKHTCRLAIPELPDVARIGDIIPGLVSHSLLSVVKLCNAGWKLAFSEIECIVKYRGRVVLKDHKCSKTGLWMVPLDTRNSPAQIANYHWGGRTADKHNANMCTYAVNYSARQASHSTKSLPSTRWDHWKQAQQCKGCIEKMIATINWFANSER